MNPFNHMSDTEAKAQRRNEVRAAMPSGNQVFNSLLNNALGFVNAYQVPRDLGANILNAFAQAPGEVYKGAKAHLSGEIPLTGERDREGAIHSFNALGNAGMALGPFAGRALQGVASTAKPARGITAYHGSPHDFDRFSMDKIGTGEGAQAYGHGMYFAESPDVAQVYKNELSDGWTIVKDGKPVDNALSSTANMHLQRASGDVDEAIRLAQSDIAYGDNTVGNKGAIDLLNNVKSGQAKLESRGRLYEVQIKANKEDFLDVDTGKNTPSSIEPILKDIAKQETNQNRVRQQRLAQSGLAPRSVQEVDWRDPLVLRLAVNDPNIVARLREAGVPGVKYLDQGSRGPGQGTYNYVIFDPDLIEITKKMGIAVPVPGVPGVVVSEEDFKALEGT